MKWRLMLSTIVLFASIGVRADEGDKPKVDEATQKKIAEIKAIQNDAEELNKYFGEAFSGIAADVRANKADEAQAKLNQLRAVLKALEPEDDKAKQLVVRANAVLGSAERQIELARVTIDDLKKKLSEDPSDSTTLNQLVQKVIMAVSPITRSEPEKAEKLLADAKEYLTELKDKVEDEAVKKRIDSTVSGTFASLERSIAAGKKLKELIGQDAAPLTVEAWVNGEALTDEDLKGKVVLLDFWAVWCGPCIATFPHLREWNEQYADKGLVMIGLTRYYNYTWDEEAGRATRAKEEVKPEAEQKMLERFAEEHDLHHRFGIQKGSELSEYYGVTGIPHVVVIDREGKIRLIRVGSGEANAKDIEAMLKKLLES